MSGLGYTPAEPIRDEDAPVYDPYEIVTCETCDGRKTVTRERKDGAIVKRRCPTCRCAEQLMRGNPLDSPYVITFDFRAGGPVA